MQLGDLKERAMGRKAWSMQVGREVCLGLLLLVGAACGDNGDDPANPSIAGVDADANGVRDDIDAYIDDSYTDTSVRNALRQYAKAAQVTMVDAADAALTETHASERFRAIECVMAQRPDDFPTVFSDLRARILNTDQRSRAYLQADGQVTANTPSLLPADQWLSACAAP